MTPCRCITLSILAGHSIMLLMNSDVSFISPKSNCWIERLSFLLPNSDTSRSPTELPIRQSRQNLLDYMPMHIRQPPFDAVVVEAEPLMIQAKQVQNRGVQIIDRGC